MPPFKQPLWVNPFLSLLQNTNTRHLAVNLLRWVMLLNSLGAVFPMVLVNSLSTLDLTAVGRLPREKDMEKGSPEQVVTGHPLAGLLLGYTCWKALPFLWNSAISSFYSETKFSPEIPLAPSLWQVSFGPFCWYISASETFSPKPFSGPQKRQLFSKYPSELWN